jgi:DNA-binding IclR family transcriptional regulator
MARSSPGVLRVASILNFIADHPDQAFTLTGLVKALKLSRATCHALLTGLVEVGYLYRASDKNYILGPALASIGRIAAQHTSPLQVAQPEMRALADEFDTICACFFRDGDDIVVRDRAASVSHVGWSVPVGTRLKLRPPFAAIFYAWSPPSEAEAWLDSSEPKPTAEHRAEMLRGMAFVKQHGFQVQVRNTNAAAGGDMTPEQTFGAQNLEFPVSVMSELQDHVAYRAVGIVAPVFDVRGQVAFVMGLTGFSQSLPGHKIRQASLALRRACDRVTTFITGRPPLAAIAAA